MQSTALSLQSQYSLPRKMLDREAAYALLLALCWIDETAVTRVNPINLTQPPLSEADLLLAVSRAARLLMKHDNWHHAMPRFMGEIGRHTGSNRVWMFQVVACTDTSYTTRYIHEWVSDPRWSNFANPELQNKVWDLTQPDIQALYQARCRGEMLQHHVHELTGNLYRELKAQDICSMLTIPIVVDGEWWGILGLDDNEAPKYYTPAHLAALETGAILVTNRILRDRMRWEADHDYLTGLYNRRFLVRLMEQEMAEGRNGGFIMLDADWFKAINDAHGHQAGDQALEHIAIILQNNVPKGACCARLGGEEFAIWVPDHDGSGRIGRMREVAEQVRLAVANTPLHWMNKAIEVTMSLGVVTSHSLPDLESLISLADQALFDAKAQGRNRIVAKR